MGHQELSATRSIRRKPIRFSRMRSTRGTCSGPPTVMYSTRTGRWNPPVGKNCGNRQSDKVCLIHDMRRNGTNSKVTFQELLKDKANDEGIDLLTLDFRDAFKQLHVVKSVGAAVFGWCCDGRGFSPTELCYLALDQVLWVWCRSMDHAQHTRMVGQRTCPNQLLRGRPHHRVRGTAEQRRKLAMGVLLWWSSLGLKLAYEKGSSGPEAGWIGTHLVVNARANRVEVRLPSKKNLDILTALSDLMDRPGA